MNHKTKLKISVFLWVAVYAFTGVKAQTATIYGVNILAITPLGNPSSYHFVRVNLVTDLNTFLPNELIVDIKQAIKKDSVLLCDSFAMITYETEEPIFINTNFSTIGIGFQNISIAYAGNNKTPSKDFIQIATGPYNQANVSSNCTVELNNTSIINIAKGQKRCVSFTNKEIDNDSTYIFDSVGNNYFINPVGVVINKQTGNIIINTDELTLGYHSIMYSIKEYGNLLNSYSLHSQNLHLFTVHVIDSNQMQANFVELLPKDSAGFPFLIQHLGDTALSYQTVLVKSGLNNPVITINSLYPMANTPNVTTIQKNDSLFIQFTIKPLYPSVPLPPKGVGVVIKYDDSTGKCHEELTSFYIRTDTKVGQEELLNKKKNLTIYPNPASQTLMIKGTDEASIFEIYTPTGACALRGEISGPIDISSLPVGLFFIHIISDENIMVRKVVKSN